MSQKDDAIAAKNVAAVGANQAHDAAQDASNAQCQAGQVSWQAGGNALPVLLECQTNAEDAANRATTASGTARVAEQSIPTIMNTQLAALAELRTIYNNNPTPENQALVDQAVLDVADIQCAWWDADAAASYSEGKRSDAEADRDSCRQFVTQFYINYPGSHPTNAQV
jgi:hypothetical protein